jgi:hypothetical protein
MMKLVLAAFAVLIFAGGSSPAVAQILDPSNVRCAEALNMPTEKALRRWAWALYCRSHQGHYPTGAPMEPEKYLSPNNIILYDEDFNPRKDNLYPAYFDFVGASGKWFIPDSLLTTGPDPRAAPTSPQVCRTNFDVPAGLFPTSALNAGLCVAGCYVADTQLQFVDGTMGIKAALGAGKLDLLTLAPDATLDNLHFISNKVERYVTDLTESIQEIYTISMRSGGRLRVTSEHPLLTSDGVIHQAQQLKLGDELMLASGKPDPIVGIELNKILDKVYNVQPVSIDYVSNIIVAGGYLNGSLRYQNEFLSLVNALILRRSLTLVEHDRS